MGRILDSFLASMITIYDSRGCPVRRPFNEGRVVVEFGNNVLDVEWSLLQKRKFGLLLHMAGNYTEPGDEQDCAISLYVGIPALGQFWLSLLHSPISQRLLRDTERVLGIEVRDGSALLYPWVSAMCDRVAISISDMIGSFARTEYLFSAQGHVCLYEGSYLANVAMHLVERRVWWFGRSKRRSWALVSVDGGIPVPGGVVSEMVVPAATVDMALRQVASRIVECRVPAGGIDWFPAGGWPNWCISEKERMCQ